MRFRQKKTQSPPPPPCDTREAEEALNALSVLGIITPRDHRGIRRQEKPVVSGTAAVRQQRRADDLRGSNELIRLPVDDLESLAREAAIVISAMEAAMEARLPQLSPMERRLRRISRVNLRVQAQLKLWADGLDGEPWHIFTRDLDGRAMGFICKDKLPLGYGGWITFNMPDGRRINLEATVTRCRPYSGGWHEGALHFTHPQGNLVDEVRQREREMAGEALPA
jgi:hypothetical protein